MTDHAKVRLGCAAFVAQLYADREEARAEWFADALHATAMEGDRDDT